MRRFASLILIFIISQSVWAHKKTARGTSPTDLPSGDLQKEEQRLKEGESGFKFIPLPVYATLPNEGSTYGFMPVFLFTDPGSERINKIVAPSVTWNDITHISTTGRFYIYPDNNQDIIIQTNMSSRVGREATFEWSNVRRDPGEYTFFLSGRYLVDPFRRFFGIGKDTGRGDETSYTLKSLKFTARGGYNLLEGLNFNMTAQFSTQRPLDINVPGIKSTFDKYSNLVGVTGSNTSSLTMGLRYDTRPNREYSEEGSLIEGQIGVAENDASGGTREYGVAKLEGRQIWKEFSWMYGAARVFWNRVFGTSDVPFFEQNSLGGSYVLRGFILDRFTDLGAWSIDFEQRITPVRFKVMGSEVHFRLDPFISIGQVYDGVGDVFDRVQFTKGVGIRAFAPPNVIGRIDIAQGGPDLNVYVELGYAFYTGYFRGAELPLPLKNARVGPMQKETTSTKSGSKSVSKTSAAHKFKLKPELLKQMHDLMVKTRCLEERLIKMYKQNDGFFWIGGPGEEAFGIPLGLLINKGKGPEYDFFHGHYRSAGTLIAMGMEPIDAMRQMKNTATDPFSGGRNFCGHISISKWNVAPITSPIEIQYSIAPGTAMVQKKMNTNGISIVTGGDAGTAEGDFASCLVWSSRPGSEVPLLIIVTNNKWGISTSYDTQHGESNIANRGKAFGIRCEVINGNDPEEAYLKLKEIMDYIRKEKKPVLLEAMVSRLYGHSSASGANFVTNEEDPIRSFEERLASAGVMTAAEMKAVWDHYNDLMATQAKQVRDEPQPDPESVWDYVFAGQKGKQGRYV